jgi:cellulose synthase operon protein C
MLRRGTSVALLLLLVVLSVACSRDPEKAKQKYLESGEQYAKDLKFAEAQIQFKNALRIDPRFAEAYYQLARTEVELKQWNDALSSFQQAVALKPDHLEARLGLGQLFLSAHDYAHVEEQASAVLENNPRNADAYQLMAASYAARQKNEQALDAFRKALELAPTASAYMNVGLAEITLLRFQDGERDLRKAIEIDPKFEAGYSNLANFYRLQRQLPAAEQLLRQGVGRIPDQSSLCLLLADILYAENKKADADSVLQTLTQRNTGTDVAIKVGDFYQGRNNSERAIAEYKRGLSADASNDELSNRLTELYLTTNRVAEAKSLNSTVLNRHPKQPIARVLSSRILLAEGKPDEAIVALQRQVADTPDLAVAHFALGLAFGQKGQLQQAKSEMQNALKASPEMVQALNELVDLNLATGDVGVAKEYAMQSVRAKPGSVDGHLLLSTSLLRNKEFPAAAQEAAQAQQLAPDNPWTHVQMAEVLAGEKKNGEAEKEFEATLAMQPQFPEGLGQLINFLVATNQQPKALARAGRYLQSYPNDAVGHAILGSLYMQLKQYANATPELERAIDLDPKLFEVYLQLGQAYQQLHEMDAAIARYQSALALRPNLPVVLTMLGNCYLDKGDLVNARKNYEQALAVDSNFAIAAGNLAWVYTKQNGNLDVALGLAQKAKQLMPELASFSDTLGWVYYKRGTYSPAIPLFKECVQKAPNSAIYHYHLGMTLLASGDKKQAKSELQSAMRLKLGSDEAQDAQQALAKLN